MRGLMRGLRPDVWLTGVALVSLQLAGCALPGDTQRDGYRVDPRYQAPSHGSRIRHLVIHYTDSDEADSLATLTGPHVSAHYVVPLPTRYRAGQPLVYQLVDESRRAWHAGESAWGERTNINDTSIGIEIVNDGPDRPFHEVERQLNEDSEGTVELHWAAFPAAQIETVIALAKDIIARHDIDPVNVVAHSDIGPTRKIDPGPAFPWQRLYSAGIGTWPEAEAIARYRQAFEIEPPALATLQHALAEWGYAVEPTGELDERTRAVVRAFQMRYRPADYHGFPDVETAAILWALLETYRPKALPILACRSCSA